MLETRSGRDETQLRLVGLQTQPWGEVFDLIALRPRLVGAMLLADSHPGDRLPAPPLAGLIARPGEPSTRAKRRSPRRRLGRAELGLSLLLSGLIKEVAERLSVEPSKGLQLDHIDAARMISIA